MLYISPLLFFAVVAPFCCCNCCWISTFSAHKDKKKRRTVNSESGWWQHNIRQLPTQNTQYITVLFTLDLHITVEYGVLCALEFSTCTQGNNYGTLYFMPHTHTHFRVHLTPLALCVAYEPILYKTDHPAAIEG